MGTQDLGCGSTVPQMRFPPHLEQGMRREQEEMALKCFLDRGRFFCFTESKRQVVPVW